MEALKDKIDALREQGVEVYEISIEGSAEGTVDAVGFVKKPTDKAINHALGLLAKSDVIGAGKLLLQNHWIGGDELILSDESMLRGAALQMLEFVEIKQAKRKKT